MTDPNRTICNPCYKAKISSGPPCFLDPFVPYLCVDVCVLPVADHLGALLHVPLQVLLVRVQERRHGRLQDAREHLDLKEGVRSLDHRQLIIKA